MKSVIFQQGINTNSKGEVTGYTSALKELGDFVFAGCSSLQSVALPYSLVSIGESTFEQCTALTNIEIPASVQSIGSTCFGLCSSLTSCTIMNQDITIASDAFKDVADNFTICLDEQGVNGVPQAYIIDEDGMPQVVEGLSAVKLYAANHAIPITYLRGNGEMANDYPLPKEVLVGQDVSLSTFLGSLSISSVTSSDTSVLSVDSGTKTVTGMKAGISILTVVHEKGTSTTIVSVYEPVTSFALDYTHLELFAGDDTQALHVISVKPDGAYPSYEWTLDSASSEVISIQTITTDQLTCNITALKVGTATITCASASGVKQTCTVTVSEMPNLESLTATSISPTLAQTTVNQLLQFTALLKDDQGNQIPVTDKTPISYVSGNTSVAIANDSGDVLTQAVGATTITAQSPSGKFDDSAVAAVIVHSDSALSLPAMLTEIEEEAFSYAPAVEVQIGGKVTSIGSKAFANCGQLKLVIIENGSCAIASNAFDGCPLDLTIVCLKGSDVAEWCAANGFLYVTVSSFN